MTPGLHEVCFCAGGYQDGKGSADLMINLYVHIGTTAPSSAALLLHRQFLKCRDPHKQEQLRCSAISFI